MLKPLTKHHGYVAPRLKYLMLSYSPDKEYLNALLNATPATAPVAVPHNPVKHPEAVFFSIKFSKKVVQHLQQVPFREHNSVLHCD